MPYVSELSRTNPGCFLFLIDQSSSMAEPFGAQPEKPKAEGVADAINRAAGTTGEARSRVRRAVPEEWLVKLKK